MDEQLQADLNEAAELEPEREPNGRKSRRKGGYPGRPVGAKNKSASKTATRLRVRDFRARKAEEAEQAEQFRIDYENILAYQKEYNLVFFGELAPGENCLTAQDELEIASEFAEAMSIPPIQAGETIRVFINRVMRQWCEIGSPLFCRETKSFGEPVATADPKRFDEQKEVVDAYEFPNGCDEAPIQEVI
jgi:hypothetical protein